MNELVLKKALNYDTITKQINHNVYARDELPEFIPYPSAIILNTKPRKHEGEHWLAIYYDKNGRSIFFDSYGEHPKQYGLVNFLNKTSINWTWNTKRIQGYSKYCGYYCLLFLFLSTRNKTKQFFSYFTNNFFLNDQKVDKLIKDI